MLSDPAIFLWGKMKKRYIKYLIMTSTVFIVLLSQNCKDTITSTDLDNIVMPDSGVSYSLHIAPVFEVKCVSCHRNERSEGGVNLSSWSDVVSDPSIVFPGSDSTSILVWTIEKIPPYPPMPPSEWLKRNHINGIRTWIREGALNN
jgi:hypothetical protein